MPACMRSTPWKKLPNHQSFPKWQPISIAPFDRDLELAIIDSNGINTFSLPCCRILGGWCDAKIKRRIEVEPTHWREWVIAPSITPLDRQPLDSHPKDRSSRSTPDV